jgi:hypothetical protein
MGTRPCDLARRDIAITAGQCPAQRFAFCRNKEPLELRCKNVERLNGLTSFATLTQNVLELIHRVGSTGQEVMALPCLHGGSPLA